MSVGIGRHNMIILFWEKGDCTVSFLGIHKWEPNIYIGFSPCSLTQKYIRNQKQNGRIAFGLAFAQAASFYLLQV
jgi:hypothetical protein